MNRLRRFETFARLGHLARGIVYVLLGYLAYASSRAKNPTNVLAEIKDLPAGETILLLVGIGLAFYGLFRLYGAVLNIDCEDSDAVGLGKRTGHVASGLGHLVLAYVAVNAAVGSATPAKSGGEEKTGEAASFLLSLPAGEILLGLIGLGFLAAAAEQAHKAWSGKFMRELQSDTPRAAKYLGHAGYAARAVVFAVIGWNIASSALAGHAREVGGIGLALEKLRENQTVFTFVAVGLLLFGLFSLIMARFAKIRDEDVVARLKSEAHALRN
jgi:hypothetical protein